MENNSKYRISFFCEFMDKTLEIEFFNYDIRRHIKLIKPVVLIFGIIYMMFLISDYYTIESTFSFRLILTIRTLVLVASVAVYVTIKKMVNYMNLIYLISAYEILAIISFLLIIFQYESLTYLSFFSVIVITLAVYFIPNRLIYTQIISTLFFLTFFIFPAKHIQGIETDELLKIFAYIVILIIYCNIGTYMTNLYKRKQFADRKELLRISITDPLTGVFNRIKFDEEINRWIDYSNRYKKPLCLVIFDVDDFKRVNDRHGHLIGDSVIQLIASTIKKEIRSTDVFARWGGEEFVILLPDTDLHQAKDMTERMRICIKKIKFDKVGSITCSFGLVELREDESTESLLKRADKYLYDAKDCGKNTVISEDGKIGERLNLLATF